MRAKIILKSKPSPFPKLMHWKWDKDYIVLFENEKQGTYLSNTSPYDCGVRSDTWELEFFVDHDKPFLLAADLLKWVVDDNIREVVLPSREGGGTVVYPPNLMGEWRETVDDFSPLEGNIILSN